MDYEKLIERLNNYLQSLAAYSDPELAHTLEDAATTLSTLQAENKRLKSLLGESGQDLWSKENQRADRLEAENEKLRAEVKMWKCRCKEIVSHASELDMDLQNAEKENAELLAELKQVIHQRDNYHMYHYELALKPNCNTCADKDCKYRPIPGDTVRANCPLWRGPDKEG